MSQHDEHEAEAGAAGESERTPDRTPDRTVRASGTVPASVDAVWHAISDLEGLPEVLRNVSRVERLEGEGFAAGVRWREYMAVGGRSYGEEMWVVSAEAPRRAVVGSQSGGVDFVSTFSFTGDGGSTELAIETAAFVDGASTSQRLTWRALGPLMMRDTRRALEGDIADISAWVTREAESAESSGEGSDLAEDGDDPAAPGADS